METGSGLRVAVIDRLLQKLDTTIYGLIGPFAVLHIFPRYFLGLEHSRGLIFSMVPIVRLTGSTLMMVGAVLAAWCALLMYLIDRGSVSPFSRPITLVTVGPYRWVRHPMMWAINLVLAGEVITFCSPSIFIWLLVWIRFSVIYIGRYEEPYLESVFGNDYVEYCRTTPRWIPHIVTSWWNTQPSGATSQQ